MTTKAAKQPVLRTCLLRFTGQPATDLHDPCHHTPLTSYNRSMTRLLPHKDLAVQLQQCAGRSGSSSTGANTQSSCTSISRAGCNNGRYLYASLVLYKCLVIADISNMILAGWSTEKLCLFAVVPSCCFAKDEGF